MLSLLPKIVRRTRRAVQAAVHPLIAPSAIRAFRSRADACRTREDALDLAFSFDYGRIRIRPLQIRSEIAAFLERMAPVAPRSILEIGTANGGSLFLLTRIAAPGALILSVDLPGGRFGGGYPSWKSPLYRAFARPGQEMVLVRADSHDPATVERIASRLGPRAVDLLFIDGDHSYAGVKSDFERYSPLVRAGGIVAFHDIVPGPEADVGGVPRFWRELKAASGGEEIVADWDQGGYGIGVAIADRAAGTYHASIPRTPSDERSA